MFENTPTPINHYFKTDVGYCISFTPITKGFILKFKTSQEQKMQTNKICVTIYLHIIDVANERESYYPKN